MINDPRLPPHFWNKVVEDDQGCWNWIGALSSRGYGQRAVNGVSKSVHRVTYLNLVGPIAEGLQIDHLCKNKQCCNPAHLEAVTARVNTRRAQGLPDHPPAPPVYVPPTEAELAERYKLSQLSMRDALDRIFYRKAS